MKRIDAHVHVGDWKLVEKYISTSEYRHKIRLYSALDAECVKLQEKHLKEYDWYFGIPIILKEIGIAEANAYLSTFAKTHHECIPVYLIGDKIEFYNEHGTRILKEHFLHHKATEWEEREELYEYLDKINGYLLIHSSDSIRIDYIKFLRSRFKNMHIIIAHMGRNVFEDYEFSQNVIDAFKYDEYVFFDTSTIKDVRILMYAYKTIGDSRILYGTDFPYECKTDWNDIQFCSKLDKMKISDASKAKILYENAYGIISKV